MEKVNSHLSALKEYNIYRKFINQNVLRQEKEKNEDILSKNPLRLMAYSNEVGSAISPINQSLGTVLWAPALLYLGADIYDKYKNEDKTYNPSGKRATKETIFQGMASVILPSSAIKLGQKIGVKLSTKKNILSPSDKKELIEFTSGFVEYGNFPNSNKEYSQLTSSLIDSFKNKAAENQKRLNKKGILSNIASIFYESKTPDSTMTKYLKNPVDSNPVIKYLTEQGELVQTIMTSEKNINADKYKNFFAKSVENGSLPELAKKNTALKILKDKNINKSLVATVAGFITLFILAKPIDSFVENIFMKKMVEPCMDKFSKNKQQKSSSK